MKKIMPLVIFTAMSLLMVRIANAAGCQGETVTCFDPQTHSAEVFQDADTCSSYWDHTLKKDVVYGSCSK